MLGGLDDPDKRNAASGDGPVCETGDEMSDKGDVVRYPDAAGEQEN
jgi:hypothetical protein